MSHKHPPSVEHPAYGIAGFSRRSGNSGRLFGSPLKEHYSTVSLTISRAALRHDLGKDWVHSTGRELVSVTFSAAQFADLLTNMNIGDGAPCTIEHVACERMPPVPEDDPIEHESVVKEFTADSQETVDRLKKQLEDLRVLLKKPKLSQEDKRAVEWMVGKALQDVEHNAPFMLRQFGEATTKIVTHAKAEMAASTRSVVEKLGLQKLGELREAVERREIEEEKK